MKAVSRFEYNLLRILHALLGQLPLEQVRPQIVQRFDPGRPPCLSRNAVELVKDTLARGIVQAVARAGGWRRERFLRGGKPKLGRLWERTSPGDLGLTFGPCTLDFLMWLTAVRPTDRKSAWQPPAPLTIGDLLLLALAYEVLQQVGEVAAAVQTLTPFTRNGLWRLMFPRVGDLLGGDPPVPDFAPWMTGPGACILEAYQIELAVNWLEAEMDKGEMTDWQRLRRLGRSQEQVLDAFLKAAEQAGRPDLARFLLRVLAAVLVEHADPQFWVGGLQTIGPRMADREETYRAALAVVRQTERLSAWQRQARRDGPFDDTYPRSQLWLADWERSGGDTLHRRAQELQRRLDPFRPT